MKQAKLKNIYLLVAVVFGLIVAYNLAISKTLGLKKEYAMLQAEAKQFDDMPTQLAILKKKDAYYDSLLTKFQINNGSVQHNLLRTLTEISNKKGIKLTSFTEPHVIKQNDLIAKTYQFSLEGDYNEILDLIYYLEQHTKFGEVINIQFEKKQHRTTRKTYLEAKVFLKSFG
ncbi:MAG: hypothetical protein EVB11_12005 [Winogradskyella sp.]|nr:MAG: hypothetical protein EVB11_12005 [Winogradskyella sp.]